MSYPPKGRTKNATIISLDRVFSEYIRKRDSQQFKGVAFKCISCGQIKPYGDADCGHFFSRTHMATRFDEDNAHAECKHCNRFSSDHLYYYQINLIKKIGQGGLDALEIRHREIKKWSTLELKELKKYYQQKINEIEK